MNKIWKRLGISLLAIPVVFLLEWLMAAISIITSPTLFIIMFGIPLLPFLLLELICFCRSVHELFEIKKRSENKMQVLILCIMSILVNLCSIYIAGQIGLIWSLAIAMGE